MAAAVAAAPPWWCPLDSSCIECALCFTHLFLCECNRGEPSSAQRQLPPLHAQLRRALESLAGPQPPSASPPSCPGVQGSSTALPGPHSTLARPPAVLPTCQGGQQLEQVPACLHAEAGRQCVGPTHQAGCRRQRRPPTQQLPSDYSAPTDSLPASAQVCSDGMAAPHMFTTPFAQPAVGGSGSMLGDSGGGSGEGPRASSAAAAGRAPSGRPPLPPGALPSRDGSGSRKVSVRLSSLTLGELAGLLVMLACKPSKLPLPEVQRACRLRSHSLLFVQYAAA